jgi:hypothetical protein
VANLPLIVLGHPETSAGHFVQRFQLGILCPYDSLELKKAAAEISSPEIQARYRQHAAKTGAALTLAQPAEWLWTSLEQATPADDRFELLMPKARRPHSGF